MTLHVTLYEVTNFTSFVLSYVMESRRPDPESIRPIKGGWGSVCRADGRRRSMGMLSVVKREIRHTAGVALYLLFCFGIFSTLNKLFLATYQIEASALVPAVIGALALAKVVVLLDMTPIATRLDTRHPIWVATLFKTLFYCAVSAPVLFGERAWHFYRETGVLGEAFVEAWKHMDPNRVLAKVIIVGLVFGCYHLYHGIDRRLGQNMLRRMILSRG